MNAVCVKNKWMNVVGSLGIAVMMGFCLMACQPAPKEDYTALPMTSPEPAETVPARVESSPVKAFAGIGKGLVEANRMVPVYGLLPLLVTESKVKEGMPVREGDLLFTLDPEENQNKLRQLKAALQEKELALRDILIGQGFSWEDTLSVPRQKMEFARIKSGYNSTLVEYEIALQEMRKTRIFAPVSGFIYKLSLYPNDYVKTSEPCCYIVNTDVLNVVFYVLESEIGKIGKDRQISVTPQAYADKVYKAKITRILPIVDEHGMIRVKARLESTEGLLPGMNVFVNL